MADKLLECSVLFVCFGLVTILYFFLLKKFKMTFIYLVCTRLFCEHVCCGACVELGGQSVGVCLLLPSCGLWGLSSGPHAWSQEPLPTGPSHWPGPLFSMADLFNSLT